VSPSAGYSGTPLARKLGIRADHRVAVLGAPGDFDSKLEPLPERITLHHRLGRGPYDVLIFLSSLRGDLERKLPALVTTLDYGGGLWLAWPKRASGLTTDLSDGLVREIGLATGLVDNKVCAIDDRWSGLRFVYRRKDRLAAST
jgi:hypothetical protein